MSPSALPLGDDPDVDELFGLPPSEFVAARDALVRRLRDAGDRDRATAVRALRRPTVVAWALNRLARDREDDVDELVQRGAAVRHAHADALAGRGGDLVTAGERLQEVVSRLARAGADLAGGHRDEIASALRAAAIDEAVGDELRAGRLQQAPAPPTGGFEAAGGVDLPAGASAGERRRVDLDRARTVRDRARDEVSRAEAALARRREHVEELEERLAAERARLADDERSLEAATGALADAGQQVERLEGGDESES